MIRRRTITYLLLPALLFLWLLPDNAAAAAEPDADIAQAGPEQSARYEEDKTASPDPAAPFPSMLDGADHTDVPSFGWMFVRTIGALCLVFILILGLVFLLKRFAFQQRMPGLKNDAISILSSTFIAPKKSIHMIQVLNRVLIVGVTDAGISILSEFHENELGTIENQNKQDTTKQPFDNVLSTLWGKIK